MKFRNISRNLSWKLVIIFLELSHFVFLSPSFVPVFRVELLTKKKRDAEVPHLLQFGLILEATIVIKV